MLDVACITGRNMDVVPRGGGRGPPMLDVTRNMLPRWLAMARNMWRWTLDLRADEMSCFKSNGHRGVSC
jgi:hypothetical protein